jgi:autotransporter-associated beta strand protein
VFDTPPVDAVLNVAAIVSGDGSLVKTGLGVVNMISNNTCTGSITVSAGTLSLSYPDLTNTATVTIATNAVLNLNFANSDTNTVAALVVNGVSKLAGLYNNGTDPLYITGSGSLLVVPLVTINPLAGPIQFSVSGSTLTLSWPTNLGWILQEQINALNVGLLTNSSAWFDVPDSASVTSTNITINPANPTMFFRLRHP